MNPLPILLALGLVAWWWYASQQASGAFSVATDGGGDTGGEGASPSPEPSPVQNLPNAPVQLDATRKGVVMLVMQLAGDIPPADVLGVIQVESSFNAAAFRPDSNGGSYGLMQLDLGAAQQVGYTGDGAGLNDPATNIALGVRYLDWISSYLASRLGQAPSEDQWISSYNAGVGNTLKGFIQSSYVTAWRAARDQWSQILAQGIA